MDPPPGLHRPYRPRWWSEAMAALWAHEEAGALAEWTSRNGLGSHVTDENAADAVALGHGARMQYPTSSVWDEVEARLKEEWVSNGPVEVPWFRVRPAVRHGWEYRFSAQPRERRRR